MKYKITAILADGTRYKLHWHHLPPMLNRTLLGSKVVAYIIHSEVAQ